MATTQSQQERKTPFYAETSLEANNDDLVRMYLKEIGNVQLLSAEEETYLALRIEDGDSEARGWAKTPCYDICHMHLEKSIHL